MSSRTSFGTPQQMNACLLDLGQVEAGPPNGLVAGLLLEREVEVSRLGEAVDAAVSGQGQYVLVEGSGGIGKTTVLDAAASLASRSGMTVLRARADELEREFPFGVVRQLFEPVLRQLSANERQTALAGAARLAAPVVAGEAATATLSWDVDLSFPVLHGLYWLCANLAGRSPLALIVDDAQWSDPASLRFVHFLVRRLEGVGVLVAAAVRSGEPDIEAGLLAQLVAEADASVLRPLPLTELAVAEIIAASLGEDPDVRFVESCRAVTGGLPFLVKELVAVLRADGIEPTAAAADMVGELAPAPVGRATLLRLARFPPMVGALARAAAVLGPDAQLHRAARLAGLDEAEASLAKDSLARAGILVRDTPPTFTHPIVRAAIYHQIGSGERSAGHALAARLLLDEGADPDAVAAHFLLTEPAGLMEVVEQLRAAAAHAIARGAPESAVAYLTRAVREGVDRQLRATLLYELAVAEKLMGHPAAIDHLRDARILAGNAVQKALAGCELADVLAVTGRWEEMLDALDTALADLGGEDGELAIRLQTRWALAASLDPGLSDALAARLPGLHEAVQQQGPATRGLALVLANLATMRGDCGTGVTSLLDQGLDDGRFLAEDGSDSHLLFMALGALVFTDRLDRVAAIAEAMAADAASRGSVYGYAASVISQAWLNTRRGDLTGTESHLRRGLELIIDNVPGLLPAALWYGLDAIVERPDLADVAGFVDGIALSGDLAATETGAILREIRGRLCQAAGDRVGAIANLRACGEIMTALGIRNPNMSSWRRALAVGLTYEDPAEAARLAAAELADARSTGLARPIGMALRTAGIVHGGSRGISELRHAIEFLERCPSALEHARGLTELGAALRRANRRTEARDHLSRAWAMATRCGATRLAKRALTELREAGGRPRRTELFGVSALTPIERRVAEMAASGLSNPEIAQTLFVARSTIETHLRHIYPKLGIASRGQLSSALSS